MFVQLNGKTSEGFGFLFELGWWLGGGGTIWAMVGERRQMKIEEGFHRTIYVRWGRGLAALDPAEACGMQKTQMTEGAAKKKTRRKTAV